MNTNATQSGLESFLTARVQHLVANTGRVRVPGDKDQLAGGPSIFRLKFQIHETVATVVFGKLFAKVFVGLGAISLAVNDNGLLVFDDVSDVTQFLALLQFEALEERGDFVVYNNSGRL